MIIVRPVRPDEWAVYRDLRLRALQDAPDAFGSTHAAECTRPEDAWRDRLSAAAASGMGRAFFATDGAMICGLVWCRLSMTEPGIADVFQMWVAPEARGRGIGAVLLREAAAFASRAGARMLRLGVTVGDSPATRLYRSFGFRPDGNPELLREGSTLLAQTMSLDLTEG